MRFSSFRPDSVNEPSLHFSGGPVRGFNRPGKGSGRRNIFNFMSLLSLTFVHLYICSISML